MTEVIFDISLSVDGSWRRTESRPTSHSARMASVCTHGLTKATPSSACLIRFRASGPWSPAAGPTRHRFRGGSRRSASADPGVQRHARRGAAATGGQRVHARQRGSNSKTSPHWFAP